MRFMTPRSQGFEYLSEDTRGLGKLRGLIDGYSGDEQVAKTGFLSHFDPTPSQGNVVLGNFI
ncbi:hypothetical protein Syun_001240 [Stephania yunnanensis]|uniref:Uncharacterized protein n=1 Tax=Stephania yunnanensis TaxID=152371 RepID=A0AAP0LED1_9MAGN